MTTQRFCFSAAKTLLFFGMASTWAQAATFPIAAGDVSGLIAAINAANANPGPDTINLAPGSIYTLTAVDNTDDFWGPTGLPRITSPLTINGNGATIQRSSASGTPNFRIFLVMVSSLIADRVTIQGGHMAPFGGGGMTMPGSNVVLKNSTLTGNSAPESGGIGNPCGTLLIESSTISSNTGGGIRNFSSPPSCLASTTISNSTVYDNFIEDSYSPAGRISVKNSIIARPPLGLGNNCYAPAGVIVSLGHNLGSDSTCGFTASGDLNNTDPLLGPLAYNGSPTPTHLPLPGSPAIDVIPVAACTNVNGDPVTTDQRGVARPQGAACDIGSVELVLAPLYNVCLLYDATKAVNGGATIPIKLQLRDGSGNDLSASTISLHAVSITKSSTSISGPVQDSGNANPDHDFRFDPTLGTTGGYIFNLSTKGLTTGTYTLNFTVTGDSFAYTAPFQVR